MPCIECGCLAKATMRGRALGYAGQGHVGTMQSTTDLNDLSLRIGLSGLSGEVMGDVFTLFKSWNYLGK